MLVSPELVLVDPELAQIARLRLAEDAVARPAPTVRLAPPRAAAAPRLRRASASARGAVARSMPTVLLLSLLLNLLFAASLLAGDSNAPTLETAAPSPSPSALAAKSEAERTVLTLLARRAAQGNAPRALVDTNTGLLKNNVLAVCRRGAGLSFVCTVRVPQQRTRRLYARYWPPEGSWPPLVTWLGYRVSG